MEYKSYPRNNTRIPHKYQKQWRKSAGIVSPTKCCSIGKNPSPILSLENSKKNGQANSNEGFLPRKLLQMTKLLGAFCTLPSALKANAFFLNNQKNATPTYEEHPYQGILHSFTLFDLFINKINPINKISIFIYL